MIYPDNFERKIGFDSVRKHLESLCHTTKGRELCAEMHFLTDFKHITRLIEETAEMVTIKQSDNEGLPIGKVRDISESISSLRVPALLHRPQCSTTLQSPSRHLEKSHHFSPATSTTKTPPSIHAFHGLPLTSLLYPLATRP